MRIATTLMLGAALLAGASADAQETRNVPAVPPRPGLAVAAAQPVSSPAAPAVPAATKPDAAKDDDSKHQLELGHMRTLVDPKAHKAVGTIPVGGDLEAGAVDGAGHAWVNVENKNEIVAIDVANWKLARRFPAGNGVYNLAMTHDGRLIATNKRGQSVSIFDPKTGKELAHLPTKRKIVHGAVVTPDDKYAFISVEGIGSEPGTVEVIDLAAMKTVATIDVGSQAAGIDFWKNEAPKP